MADGSTGDFLEYTTSNVLTAYPAALSTLSDICSDGTDLWATYPQSSLFPTDPSALWKMTTSGTASGYNLTSFYSPITEALGVCLGPDGRLWVTDNDGIVGVWAVTTGGSITAYAFSSSAFGHDICSDGTYLWMTDQTNGGIWQITTSGGNTFFSGMTAATYVCFGPDGNLWVTSPNYVWKVSTGGSILNTYSTASSSFGRIYSDGTYLWICDNTGVIWRLTTGGVFTEFPLPDPFNNFPAGIVLGPDSNYWICGFDFNANQGAVWKFDGRPPSSALWYVGFIALTTM